MGFTGDPEIAFMRGNWHYDRKEFDRALELYDWTLTLKPDHEDAWCNKGVVLGQLGRYEEALTCLNKLIAIKPDHEDAWCNIRALAELSTRER